MPVGHPGSWGGSLAFRERWVDATTGGRILVTFWIATRKRPNARSSGCFWARLAGCYSWWRLGSAATGFISNGNQAGRSGEQKLILRVVKSGQRPWLLGAHLR